MKGEGLFPLLVVESSSKILSAALFKSAEDYDQIISLPDDVAHSQKLLPLIDSLLRKHALTHQNIESVGLTYGPGAYTSLRVGAATLLGLAKMRQLPVYAASSLASLCKGIEQNQATLIPVYLAGRGRYYAGVYQKTGNKIISLVDDQVYNQNDLLELLDSQSKEAFLIGPGVNGLNEAKVSLHHATVDVMPQALYVAKMILDSGIKPTTIHEFKLQYLQPPDFG
ncbi:tRNA (adenosine(37)-N6)-threonylcarbamoyltransferase complex dimerization subunit type 1 TsaB [bacterium]|nr:tRNA (adenosine(37)-N6)-threonylcarbamoyltransferase complex dimerization subunit type 1 TsaB [bacterium]